MNIDVDEIMLLSAQYTSRLVQEYMQQRKVSGLEGKAKFLVDTISQYLSEDRSTLAIKKSAVEYHSAIMIGMMKKMNQIGKVEDYNKFVPTLNELHKNFAAHCQQAEEIFEGVQDNILKSTAKNKI